jgi:hypothetical protein
MRGIVGIELETNVHNNKIFHPNYTIPAFHTLGSLAVTAFTLSSIQDPVIRKERLKEMWEAGTEYIVSSSIHLSRIY